jgi:hypothetical protein
MRKKITHEKVMMVDSILARLGTSTEPWFAYSVSQNRTLLEPIVNAVKAAQKRAPEFEKFEEHRNELLKKHAKKDENGKPIGHTQNYGGGMSGIVYDIEDHEALKADVDALKETDEFKDVVETEDARRQKLVALMEKEVEVEVFVIKMSDAPEKFITGNEMTLLTQAGILEWDLQREKVTKEGAKDE